MVNGDRHRWHWARRSARPSARPARLAALAALAGCALAFAVAPASPALATLTDAQTYASTLTFAEVAPESPGLVTLTLDANGGAFAPEAALAGGTLADGGTSYAYADILAGTALGDLPTPARDGHDFAGWWSEPDGGERIGVKVPELSATYYAHWRHEELVFWALDADGLLVVAPSAEAATRGRATVADGSFARTDTSGHPGWAGEAERIRRVEVAGGVRPLSTERWFTTENTLLNHFDFTGYPNLVSADLTGLDGSELTSMRAMFANCRQLARVDFGQLNTSHVKDMSWLFLYCPALASLDLTSFDTAQVTNMSYLLDGCVSLARLETGALWACAGRWYGFPSARLPRAMSMDGTTAREKGSEVADGAHSFTATAPQADGTQLA